MRLRPPKMGDRSTDIDIYRAASVLIREHGDQDLIESAQRADAMLDKGDLDGQAVWMRMLRASGSFRTGSRSGS